jgi:5-aminopentanamidase
MKSFKLAVVQSTFEPEKVDPNIEKMEKLTESCVQEYPNIPMILFPELSSTGYFLSSSLRKVAQTNDGYSFQKLSALAKKHKIHIVYGYVEQGDPGNIYNSVQLIDPNGKSLANYRKIHLTPLEKDYFQAGDKSVVVDTSLGRIGLMICWDLAFPELARLLAVEGAELLLAPSAWEDPFNKPYLNFGMARAIDNTVFLASSNHIGSSSSLEFFGQSSIYGPDGEVLSRAEAYKDEIITADILKDSRQKLKDEFFSMLEERRLDIY